MKRRYAQLMRRRKRTKYILYKQLYPKIRYLRTTYKSLYPERWTIQDNADLMFGSLVFPTNVPWNLGYAEGITGRTHAVLKNTTANTNSAILGVNIGIEALDVERPDARQFNSRINTALGPIYEDTNGSVLSDEYSWPAGDGFHELGNHYKLAYVERTKIKFHFQQRVSTVDYDATTNAGPHWADTTDTLPGFVVWTRELNTTEYAALGSYANTNSDTNDDVVGIHRNLEQSDRVHSRRFPEIVSDQKTRHFNVIRSFVTHRMDPNVEIDQLVNTTFVGKQDDHTNPATWVAPAALTYGELGFAMLLSQESKTANNLIFDVLVTVIKDIILFDRDDLPSYSWDTGDDNRSRSGADVGTTSHTRTTAA